MIVHFDPFVCVDILIPQDIFTPKAAIPLPRDLPGCPPIPVGASLSEETDLAVHLMRGMLMDSSLAKYQDLEVVARTRKQAFHLAEVFSFDPFDLCFLCFAKLFILPTPCLVVCECYLRRTIYSSSGAHPKESCGRFRSTASGGSFFEGRCPDGSVEEGL